jgi:hypothetical protein
LRYNFAVSKIKLVFVCITFFGVLCFLVLFIFKDTKVNSSSHNEEKQQQSSSTQDVFQETAPVGEVRHEKTDIDSVPIKNDKREAFTDLSCDYKSMRMYLASLLAQPVWDKILSEYPLSQYRDVADTDLEVLVNGQHPRLCVVELTLTSSELTFFEHEALQHPFYKTVSQVLTILNPTEDYSVGDFTFIAGNATPLSFYLADGPSSSMYGTYQYNEEKDTIRLFTVSGGTKRAKSIYEVTEDGETCPCQESLSIRMTKEIPVGDLSQ